MKKNIFFISIILIISLLFFKSLFNTNTMKPEDFKGTNPTIKIEKYFEGHVKAWGLLQDRKGKVTRQFKAKMFGSFENNILLVHLIHCKQKKFVLKVKDYLYNHLV